MANEKELVEYEITKRAGKRVAGRIVAGLKTMMLLPVEAEHALREGTLVRKGDKLDPAFGSKSEATAGLNAQAADVKTPPVPASGASEAENGKGTSNGA